MDSEWLESEDSLIVSLANDRGSHSDVSVIMMVLSKSAGMIHRRLVELKSRIDNKEGYERLLRLFAIRAQFE